MTARPATLLWALRRVGRVLACARAVARWRRGLTGEARRLGGLRRLAAWLSVLSAPPPSLLQNEEPYGILGALVDETGEHGDDRERSASRPRRSERGLAAARAAREPGHAGPRRRRRTGLSSLVPAPVVDEAGAGAALPRASVRHRRPLPIVAGSGRTRGLAHVTGTRRKRHAATLVDIVAGRAARRLAAAATVGSVPPTAPQAPAAERPSRSATESAAAVATGGAEAVLAGQWATALRGRPAPAELLVRLSGTRRERVDAPGEASRERTAEPPPAASALTRKTNGTSAHVSSRPEAHALAPLPDADAGILRTSAPSTEPPPLATGLSGEELGEPLRVLASDAPAQGLGPRAEAAARLRLVSVEQAAHGAELDELAAKVKRILDEEARRHGIDV